jgi:hypothetical protein
MSERSDDASLFFVPVKRVKEVAQVFIVPNRQKTACYLLGRLIGGFTQSHSFCPKGATRVLVRNGFCSCRCHTVFIDWFYTCTRD